MIYLLLFQQRNRALPAELLQTILFKANAIAYNELLQDRFSELNAVSEETQQLKLSHRDKITTSKNQTFEENTAHDVKEIESTNVEFKTRTGVKSLAQLVRFIRENTSSFITRSNTRRDFDQRGNMSMKLAAMRSLNLILFVCIEWYQVAVYHQASLQRQFLSKLQIYLTTNASIACEVCY